MSEVWLESEEGAVLRQGEQHLFMWLLASFCWHHQDLPNARAIQNFYITSPALCDVCFGRARIPLQPTQQKRPFCLRESRLEEKWGQVSQILNKWGSGEGETELGQRLLAVRAMNESAVHLWICLPPL